MKGASLARAAVIGILAASAGAGACTRHVQQGPTTFAAQPAPGARPVTAVELFGQTCLDCHDGTDPSRPDFSRKALDPSTASDALALLFQRSMPPPDVSKLDDPHREILAKWLCLQTQRSQAVCDETVRNEFAPDARRSSTALVAMIQRTSGGTISEDSKDQLQKASGEMTNEQHLRWTAVVLLAVMDACRQPDPAAKPTSSSDGSADKAPPRPLTAEAQQQMRSCVATHLRAAFQPPKKPRADP